MLFIASKRVKLLPNPVIGINFKGKHRYQRKRIAIIMYSKKNNSRRFDQRKQIMNQHNKDQPSINQKNEVVHKRWKLHNQDPLKNIQNEIGLGIREVEQDGNSLFRAISDQFMGEQDLHEYFRLTACDCMKEHSRIFQPLISKESLYSYINKMKQLGFEATSLHELLAISLDYQVNVCIFEDTNYQKPFNLIDNFYDREFIYISRHNQGNFNSVRLKGDKDDQPIGYYQYEIAQKIKILSQYNDNKDRENFQGRSKQQQQKKESQYEEESRKTRNRLANQQTQTAKQHETQQDIISGKFYDQPNNKSQIQKNFKNQQLLQKDGKTNQHLENSLDHKNTMQLQGRPQRKKETIQKTKSETGVYIKPQGGKTIQKSSKKKQKQMRWPFQWLAPSQPYLNPFETYLSELGLRIKQMPGDGNCLFHSIGDQLWGDRKNTWMTRQYIMNYVEGNEDRFKDYVIGQSFDYYVYRKRKPGVWGGEIELWAASELYKVNICVFTNDLPPRLIGNFPSKHKTICISYHGRAHYNSIRRENDYTLGEPLKLPIEAIRVEDLQVETKQTKSDQELDEYYQISDAYGENGAKPVKIGEQKDARQKAIEQVREDIRRNRKRKLETSLKKEVSKQNKRSYPINTSNREENGEEKESVSQTSKSESTQNGVGAIEREKERQQKENEIQPVLQTNAFDSASDRVLEDEQQKEREDEEKEQQSILYVSDNTNTHNGVKEEVVEDQKRRQVEAVVFPQNKVQLAGNIKSSSIFYQLSQFSIKQSQSLTKSSSRQIMALENNQQVGDRDMDNVTRNVYYVAFYCLFINYYSYTLALQKLSYKIFLKSFLNILNADNGNNTNFILGDNLVFSSEVNQHNLDKQNKQVLQVWNTLRFLQSQNGNDRMCQLQSLLEQQDLEDKHPVYEQQALRACCKN